MPYDIDPPVVEAALAVAETMSFTRSCSRETGRLLRVLTAQVRSGTVGEIGTGCGAGAAWIASALHDGVSLVTVEAEESLARAAKGLLAGRPGVTLIHGDWSEVLSYGPFTLLFVDAAPAKHGDPEVLLGALDMGGVILLDDLTPGGTGEFDPLREFWLSDLRLVATEVSVSGSESVLLATRVV